DISPRNLSTQTTRIRDFRIGRCLSDPNRRLGTIQQRGGRRSGERFGFTPLVPSPISLLPGYAGSRAGNALPPEWTTPGLRVLPAAVRATAPCAGPPPCHQ